jgi:hypothetical protein
MFWDFNILPMACVNVIEILCVMKKQNLEQNVEAHNSIAQKNWISAFSSLTQIFLKE